MNRTELLDSLYTTRRELLRLIMASAQTHVDPAKLVALVQKRDAVTWTINALIDAEVQASVGDIATALTGIEAAAKALHGLDDIVGDIDKAIGYAKDAVDAATSVIQAI